MHLRGQDPLKTLSLDVLQYTVGNSTMKVNNTLRDFPGGLLSMPIIKIKVYYLKIR